MDRPALRARLDAGLDSPLSLVVAPAGAGKTVLLSQWAAAHPDLPVAWLDIGAGAADALGLARRIAAAIAEVVPGFRAPVGLVGASEDKLGEPFLEELAASLADAGRVVVIFDDLDRLLGSAVLADLWRMVDLLPPMTHFIFASRVDLQLGWSRHRLEHGLVELRQEQLAFDAATTAGVIRAITGQPIAEDDAAEVTARTEGWAVGVQLTALSLRFSPDPGRVVDGLNETDRLVLDYLSEEVLDALDRPRRMSLKQLAVVDQFSAPLVERILGVPGAEFIAELERDSMFVVPVPGEPGWYRFHRLFRDLLLLRLRARAPKLEPEVLQTAAQWCTDEGREAEAIEYLLRGHHFEKAIDRVLSLGREVYERQGTRAVARWLSLVPSSVRARRPEAELLLGIAEGMSGRGVVAVDAMRSILAERTLTVGERQIALTYLAACVQFHPDTGLFIDAARRALALLDEQPDAERPVLLGLTTAPLMRVVALGSLGRAHLFRGELGAARTALTAALGIDGIAYRPYRVHALGSLALVEAFAGRLVAAGDLADEALAIATQFDLLTHPAPADAYIARALVAIQRGEPDVGALSLVEGSVRASSNQRTELMWLARLASLIIDPPDTVESVPEPAGPPPSFVRVSTAALTLRRARLRGTPVLPAGPAASSWSFVAFEEIAALLTLGRPEAARSRLAHVRFEPDPLAPLPLVERDLLMGWMYALEGRRGPSREHLTAALGRAEPEWLVHPFVRAGPAVADLIEDLPGLGGSFRRLVIRRGRVGATPRQQPLADELTPRELELLAYLPSRLTIAEIAERCFVSTNTVKTHMGHIYRKLDVTGRDAAIARATELGLLDDAEIARVG